MPPEPPSPTVPRRALRRARVRVGAGAAIVLVLISVAVAVVVTGVSTAGSTTILDAAGAGHESSATHEPAASAEATQSAASATEPSIYVHVLGAVRVPGLYLLTADDRAVDAVAAAGGFTATADQSGVNLARRLVDGEQFRVPEQGEAPVMAPPAAAAGGVGSEAAGAAPSATSPVNLNTATAEQLEALNGIGPSTAAKIIAWREEHNGFRSVDDLLEVSGIGEKTLDGFRAEVTV